MKAVHFDRDGDGSSPRCGTRGWSRMTADGADVSCLLCLNLMAGTGTRWDVRPCGQAAAYYRELRRGGPVHEECRRAANRDAADRRARRRREQPEEVLAA